MSLNTNWLESLVEAIGAKISNELKQPAILGSLARRMYDRNGNVIYATYDGRQMLPVNNALTGFHWCLSSEVARGDFSGIFSYVLNMQFVIIGAGTFPETTAFQVSEAIGGGYNLVSAEVGNATAVPTTLSYDLPTVLGSHFSHLQEQILSGQMNLFAAEVSYQIKVGKK